MKLGRIDKGRQGFTLTELAVVLLIAGTIIGALWLAAQNSWDNYKVYRASQQMSKFTQNIREYYMSCQQLPPGNCSSTTAAVGADETVALDALGLFPAEMRRNPNAAPGASSIDHPFNALLNNGSLHVRSVVCGAGAGPLACFRVQMQGLAQKPCIRLLTFVPINDADLAITQVGVQNMTSSFATPTTLMNAGQAETWCNQAGNTNEVDWDFKLRN